MGNINIGGRLHSTATGNVVAGANEILDDVKEKKQSVINAETDAALDDRYTKDETYSKQELDSLITTPNQEYVTVEDYDSLPESGEADTIYRVANWDGSLATPAVDITKYSEYAWDGSQYVFLCVKSQIGEVFDISVYNNNAKYADLAAALNGGANIPQSLQKGGMSVKFVQSSDNKYVQYRLKKQTFTINEEDWEIYVSENDIVVIEKETLGIKINLGDCDTGVYYVFSSGERSNSIHVRHSNVIPVNTGDVFDYVLYGYLSYYIITAFDSQGSLLPNSSVRGDITETERRYVVPEGVKYIQFFNDADTHDTDYVVSYGTIEGLSDYVDNTINGKTLLMENCKGGLYYFTDGSLKNSENVRHTDIFPVKSGDMFRYSLFAYYTYFIVVAFDSKMQPIIASSISTDAELKTDKYIVPNGVSFVQFFNDASATGNYVKCVGVDEIVDHNHDEIIEYTADDGYYEDFDSFEGGYGYLTNGNKYDSVNIYHSSIIPVIEGQKVNYKVLASNTLLALAAFDKDKNIVLSACVQGNFAAYQQNIYTVPSGVTYIQVFVTDGGFPLSFVFVHPQKTLFVPKTSRNTNVFWGYKNFGMTNSRQSLSQTEYSEDTKQIITPDIYHIAQMKFEMAFEPTSNDCFIAIGTYMSQHTVELRVTGNTMSIRVDGTWIGSSKVAFTDTLPFSITNGKKYTMSIQTFDNYGNDKECSALFSVTDGTDTYTKKVLRTYAESYDNGVKGENIAANVMGQLYISLKQGSADIVNVNVSSDYNPRVKVAIAGDSFVEGNTLVPLNGDTPQLDKRYCSLIQDEVGVKNMLIDYLPGGKADSGWFSRVVNICKDFQPDYFILAMGTNNTNYDVYLNIYTVLLDLIEYYGVKPILVTVTPWSGNADFQPLANSFVRNSGLRYVDVCKAVTVSGNERQWKDGYVFGDGIHPSVLGHQAIYEAFTKEMPELFN